MGKIMSALSKYIKSNRYVRIILIVLMALIPVATGISLCSSSASDQYWNKEAASNVKILKKIQTHTSAGIARCTVIVRTENGTIKELDQTASWCFTHPVDTFAMVKLPVEFQPVDRFISTVTVVFGSILIVYSVMALMIFSAVTFSSYRSRKTDTKKVTGEQIKHE